MQDEVLYACVRRVRNSQHAAGRRADPPRAEAYLDVCLVNRAVKGLALEARSDPSLIAPMAARHGRFATAAIPSLKAMGWADAPATAQLVAAMTAEIAIRELDAGRRLPASRRALRRFLAA